MHFTKQRLIELVSNKKIVWLVIESNLTFAKPTDEWTNTKLIFEISKKGNKEQITFTHEGLIQKFECYKNCSDAWTQYLNKLTEKLK